MSQNNAKKLISIVTPVYNEEENIDLYYSEFSKVFDRLSYRYDFEIVFTDNCSTDNTFARIRQLADKDKRIRAFRFSRNFGFQKSIFTAFSKTRGDAAIVFDCDLQDSPELLDLFLKEWEDGYDITYGVRKTRPEGAFITSLRQIFYRLLNAISEHDLPPDAGDFMLLDRRVLNELLRIDDQTPYLRGTIFSLGFKQKAIPYDRRPRQFGTSKFPFLKLLSLAVDGIVSQSNLPLRIASYTGLCIAGLTLLMSAGYLVSKLIFGAKIAPGFTTTVLLILFSISLNALFLGIIGEYLARIYSQVKKRPLTIIQETVGDLDYPAIVQKAPAAIDSAAAKTGTL